MNTNRIFGDNIQGKQLDENDFVDVCSTDDDDENKENSAPSLKSPSRKNCLTATFSRMSPFKSTKPVASTSSPNASCSTVYSHRPCNLNGSSAKSSRRSLFPNFKKADFDTSTSSRNVDEVNDVQYDYNICKNLNVPECSTNISNRSVISTVSCDNALENSGICRIPANSTTHRLTKNESYDESILVNSSHQNHFSNLQNSSSFMPAPQPDIKLFENQHRSDYASISFNANVGSGAFGNKSQNLESQSAVRTASNNTASNDDAESETEESDTMTATGGSSEPGGKASTKVKPPRKEKSLGNLCKRFLLTMGELSTASTNDVHLESVAKKMKVEKRRIYDIVNVMEALEAMSKTNKSFYKWHGLSALPQLMHALQKEAIEAKFPEKIRQVEQAMCSFTELSSVRKSFVSGNFRPKISTSLGNLTADSSNAISRTPSNSSLCGSVKDDSLLSQKSLNAFGNESWTYSSENSFNTSTDTISSISMDIGAPKTSSQSSSDENFERGNSGKNSLVHLCRRFLMMLLCDPDKRRVSLDVLSTVLIKDPGCEDFTPPDRSRCRRLYDIANVLVAMELIKKVHYLFGTKKIPLFVYCGPEPDASAISAELSMRQFLERIGLSAINVGNDYNRRNTDSLSGKNSPNLTSDSSAQDLRKFRAPKIQHKPIFGSNDEGRNLTNVLVESKFTPPLPPTFANKSSISKLLVKNSSIGNNQSYSHFREEENFKSREAFAELSPVSRSLSSSSSSISSTLSQPSSSIHYLAEMAEFVRKRLHSAVKPNALSENNGFFTSPANEIENEGKENCAQFSNKMMKHKRQKFSNGMTTLNSRNPTSVGLFLATNSTAESEELPKPKPLNPLTPLHFLSQPAESTTTVTAASVAAAMNGILKGMAPQLNSNIQPMASDLGFPFLDYSNIATSYSSNMASSLNQKPKVAHSVSSILGVSQAENLCNNVKPNFELLTSSPKAFKPVTKSNNRFSQDQQFL